MMEGSPFLGCVTSKQICVNTSEALHLDFACIDSSTENR